MSQVILAIETSLQSCGVAIGNANGVRSLQKTAARQHASLLLPMLRELLTESNITLQEVHAIAFACGPGSFTGARIAASVTQGLAFAAEARAIPVSSLLVLAHSYVRKLAAAKAVTLFVLLDAHMGEYYAACYQFDSNGALAETMLQDSLLSDIQLVEEMSRYTDAVLLGNGIQVLLDKSDKGLSDSLKQRLQAVAEAERSIQADARSVLTIAEDMLGAGISYPAEQALPVYLRERGAWKTVEQQNSL